MARSKAAKFKHKLQFYVPAGEPIMNPDTYQLEASYVPYKRIWCKVEGIFREQLEVYLNDSIPINRDRKKVTTRYRDDISADMRVEIKGHIYSVGLVGDNQGDGLEVEFLVERIVDGGE